MQIQMLSLPTSTWRGALYALAVFFVGSFVGCGVLTPASNGDDGAESTFSSDLETVTDGPESYEGELLASLSPLPDLPRDSTNAVADDPLAAELGQRLYFDARFSPTGVACATCHSGEYLDDQRGPERFTDPPPDPGGGYGSSEGGGRNALAITNSSFYRWTNWGGRFASQWELPLAVVENPGIMNGSRLQVAHWIAQRYRGDYEAVFGPIDPAIETDPTRFPEHGKPGSLAWRGMTDEDQHTVNTIFVGYGKAIQAYMRLLVSREAPFDRFAAGDEEAIDGASKRGLELFTGRARCNYCHMGPNFTDDDFHNTGVPVLGHLPDDGRFKDIRGLLGSPLNVASEFSDDRRSGRLDGLTDPPPMITHGQFRTPSLRGVALTPPYMHGGQFETLAEVLDFYDRGGDTIQIGVRDARMLPLHLSAEDKGDLIAFLESLTGERLPEHLTKPPTTN